MPSRMFVLRLFIVLYVLLCLVICGLAGRHFQTRLAQLSSVSQFVGVVAGYFVVLGSLALVLAVGFALLTPGKLFAVVGFVSAQLFFVLPGALVIFSAIIWTHRSPQFSAVSSGLLALSLLAGAVLLLGIYLYAHFIEPYRVQTTLTQVRSAKLAPMDGPLRIVVLADIQTDSVADYERDVFSRVLELKPDLILFAGDYLQCPDSETYRLCVERFGKMFQELDFDAPLGVFAVPGDCEAYNGNDCFDGTVVQWLSDQSVMIEKDKVAISLTGLSLQSGTQLTAVPAKLLDGLDKSSFNVVLAHQPNFALDLPSDHGVDLCLAGHTHGGQICLPFIGALTTACRIPRAQASGLFEMNGTRLCISRGIGMERGSAPRLRFFCRPEIMVIDLIGP